MSFDIGAIVRVPFPITEKKGRKFRPALVVAQFRVTRDINLLWTLMITGANREKWEGDVELPDHEAIGLPIASMVRTAKIATIDACEAQPIAQIDGDLLQQILARVRAGVAVVPAL